MALACAGAAAGVFLWISLQRIAYPYDLEWMEGGMLCHALRLLRGQPIYVPPSVEFVPHLYTPLYPALVAGLGRLTGDVGYLAARSISLLSFVGALGIGAWLAARAGGSAALGLAAMGLPLAAFPLTGGFYDLARSDSLQLLLTVGGAALAWHGRGRHALMLLAAVVLVAAFLAKQSAAPLIAATGAALLCTRRRTALTLAVAGGVLFAATVLLLNTASDGWFWTYIFRLHQAHAFYSRRAFVETPLLLARWLGPALLLLPWALFVRSRGGQELLYVIWLGLAGVLAACLGFGTQWAHSNAYIPGVFFPAIAVGAAAGRLSSGSGALPPRRLAAGGILALSIVLLLHQAYASRSPSAHLPTANDRAAGDALLARLRAAPGEVLIPFHPFYGHLAGKRTYLHRMGIWDVHGTIAGPVRGLAEAIRERRFALIIFDDKVEWTWHDWPGVLEHYQIAERFSGPQVVEGAATVPRLALVPALPVDMELQ
ncbi:MAG: hypothetical protein RMK29_00530 [Myxococcales bacterium]|nr:hypothetical protein [Myxococcales bacterium]